MAGHFKQLATGVLLLSVGFCLGTIYSNWTFDWYLLWESPTPPEWVDRALQYYKLKAEQSIALHHVLHGVIFLGFAGLFAKIYKPTEANTLFDGGSLVLFFIATVFYIANMRPASYSLKTGDWGDIDGAAGLRLIAAAQVIIVLMLLGVLAMQFGQWWAIPKEQQEAERIAAERAAEKTAAEKTDKDEPAAVASGSSSNKKASKRK